MSIGIPPWAPNVPAWFGLDVLVVVVAAGVDDEFGAKAPDQFAEKLAIGFFPL